MPLLLSGPVVCSGAWLRLIVTVFRENPLVELDLVPIRHLDLFQENGLGGIPHLSRHLSPSVLKIAWHACVLWCGKF